MLQWKPLEIFEIFLKVFLSAKKENYLFFKCLSTSMEYALLILKKTTPVGMITWSRNSKTEKLKMPLICCDSCF